MEIAKLQVHLRQISSEKSGLKHVASASSESCFRGPLRLRSFPLPPILCGRIQIVWGAANTYPIGAKHVPISRASRHPGRNNNPRVSRTLGLCGRGRSLIIMDTTTGAGCCTKIFQAPTRQLRDEKRGTAIGGTLGGGAAVELRLYNGPRSQPVRSTHLGVRKYRQLVATSRALGCIGDV